MCMDTYIYAYIHTCILMYCTCIKFRGMKFVLWLEKIQGSIFSSGVIFVNTL